jgi:hypothetical protein
MHIDWTINLGNLIPIMTVMIIVIRKMSSMETKVDAMWSVFTNELKFSGRRTYVK